MWRMAKNEAWQNVTHGKTMRMAKRDAWQNVMHGKTWRMKKSYTWQNMTPKSDAYHTVTHTKQWCTTKLSWRKCFVFKFNCVPGSVSGSRREQMTHKNSKKLKNFILLSTGSLDVLFWGLKANVTKTWCIPNRDASQTVTHTKQWSTTNFSRRQCCGSGFHGVPGSVSRSKRAQMTHKNRKKS